MCDEPSITSAAMLSELAREATLKASVPIQHGGAGGSLVQTLDTVAELAGQHLLKARALASQRLLIEAVMQAQNVALFEHHLPALLAGDIGGTCTASWPLTGPVRPLAATDTGRGWRMSGRLPAAPNLDAAWFLASLPVSFDGGASYSLVLLRSDEDGLRVHDAGADGSILELNQVFLREDEIISTDGPAAMTRLGLLSAALQAATWAGAAAAKPRQHGPAEELQAHFMALRNCIERGVAPPLRLMQATQAMATWTHPGLAMVCA
jgi:hypothetical protein